MSLGLSSCEVSKDGPKDITRGRSTKYFGDILNLGSNKINSSTKDVIYQCMALRAITESYLVAPNYL